MGDAFKQINNKAAQPDSSHREHRGLAHQAIKEKVGTSTQNQALSALLFLI